MLQLSLSRDVAIATSMQQNNSNLLTYAQLIAHHLYTTHSSRRQWSPMAGRDVHG